MDNFDLKKYLTEGKLHESNLNKDTTQRIKDLELDIRELEATHDRIHAMETKQYIRNVISNYKEKIEKLKSGIPSDEVLENTNEEYNGNNFSLTRDQQEIEDNFLTYWKLQQCEEIKPGLWSVLFNYAFDGEGEQSHNLDVKATSYDEAEHKAYVYTLDNLS